MNILTIPLRNMLRKPAKTLLLLSIFSLGVISIVALYQVSLVVGRSLEQKLTAFGANIVISPATEKLSVSYGGFHMGDMFFDVQELSEGTTVEAISSIALKDRISVIAPKLVTTVKINEIAIALVGVRWDEEMGIKSYWAIDGKLPESENEVLLGSLAAAKLGMKKGDSIVIHDREFTVSGSLYETGSDDDSVIFMEIGLLQGLVKRPGAVSFIEVAALCSGCPIEDIVGQIKKSLPGMSVTALQNVVNQRMASVHFVQKLALSISLVILLTASAMMGLSMLSAVNERKRDIGILRSLGYAKSMIFIIFCLEAGMVGLMAGSAGYLIGFGASFKALEFLQLGDGLTPAFSFMQLILASVSFFLISIVSALYPAWKGAAIEPSHALVAL